MMKAVVIYSGGMDSFSVLNLARNSGREVLALSLNYGQRHVKELDVASAVTSRLGIEHAILDAGFLSGVLGGSALTSPDMDVPLGHYAGPNMKQTVVPNRNMIILSLAIGYAVANEADEVWCGVHAGDHAVYPDCRPSFIEAMNHVSDIANYDPVVVHAPFLHNSKGEILSRSIGDGILTVDDYADTWTCYNGREKACGKCGACVERLEAFADIGATDPLEYEVDA